MSLENLGIFQLNEEVALSPLCHSSTATVCGNFARHWLAFSGLSN
jgi:hypothetical protein